jgi:hypothetical protein
MATYEELAGLRADDVLKGKVAVAVAIKANAIRALPTPTKAQSQFAAGVFAGKGAAQTLGIFEILLAKVAGDALAAIQGKTDVQIQTAVDNLIDDATT